MEPPTGKINFVFRKKVPKRDLFSQDFFEKVYFLFQTRNERTNERLQPKRNQFLSELLAPQKQGVRKKG